jgi:hypothetical protein
MYALKNILFTAMLAIGAAALGSKVQEAARWTAK